MDNLPQNLPAFARYARAQERQREAFTRRLARNAARHPELTAEYAGAAYDQLSALHQQAEADTANTAAPTFPPVQLGMLPLDGGRHIVGTDAALMLLVGLGLLAHRGEVAEAVLTAILARFARTGEPPMVAPTTDYVTLMEVARAIIAAGGEAALPDRALLAAWLAGDHDTGDTPDDPHEA